MLCTNFEYDMTFFRKWAWFYLTLKKDYVPLYVTFIKIKLVKTTFSVTPNTKFNRNRSSKLITFFRR
jgi:hypothetical protein